VVEFYIILVSSNDYQIKIIKKNALHVITQIVCVAYKFKTIHNIMLMIDWKLNCMNKFAGERDWLKTHIDHEEWTQKNYLLSIYYIRIQYI